MKIKKLEPQNVSEKTLAYKEYRKNIKPALKKMIAEHNSPETSTRFIVKTNFEFNDMKGKKMGLIIPGDHTGPWRNMAREEVKIESMAVRWSGGESAFLNPGDILTVRELMHGMLV